jgi:hypothetical protein
MAIGAKYGCGIGSGQNARCGSLDFVNGSYAAHCRSDGGAGIGSGYLDTSGTSTGENISIHNGNITAWGYHGGGIGSGSASSGTSSVGNISIHNGSINATGSSYGAGIGSGYGYNSGTSSIGNISIRNGNITAISSFRGAGIGSGYAYDSGTSSVGNISIHNGSITATGSYGAGIGSGHGDSGGTSSVGNIFIHNGSIIAAGSNSAGIGHGYLNYSSVNTVSITGRSISILNGTVGAGTEDMTAGPKLTIGSPHIDCRSIGVQTCLQAPSIVFDNGSFTAVTGAPNLIKSNTTSFSGLPSIYVIYSGSSKKNSLDCQ